MRRLFIAALIVTVFSSIGLSQPKLRPHIGLRSVPKDTDPICTIIPYMGSYDMNGLPYGQTANDFTLYDREGNPLTLSTILQQKKPVLLISGSYTCPVFRFRIPVINALVKRYGGKVNIYIIYTFEAHPYQDMQPFGEDPDAESTNQEEGILCRQPKTYGERKLAADEMRKSIEIDAPILFDGPCNEWNTHFGPAPNNAYLIDTNGVITIKQPWFNEWPDDILLDMEKLFQGSSNNAATSDSGIFSFRINTSAVTGNPGELIHVGGILVNESDQDAVVSIARTQSDMPSDWRTSLCSYVCSSPAIDSLSVRVLSHSTQEIKVYFYTGKNPGQGEITLHFANTNVADNEVTTSLQGMTMQKSAVSVINKPEHFGIKLLPNPLHKMLKVLISDPYTELRIVDELGRIVFHQDCSQVYDLSSLSEGMYSVQIFSDEHTMLGTAKLIKE